MSDSKLSRALGQACKDARSEIYSPRIPDEMDGTAQKFDGYVSEKLEKRRKKRYKILHPNIYFIFSRN